MQVRRISTEDGSDSLYVPDLDETYHSKHGAIQESEHVFIKNGLEHYLAKHHPEDLRILEFGFGTGLNALLTFANQKAVRIAYTSLEKYPVAPEVAKQLNYGDQLGIPGFFSQLHDCPWGSRQQLSDRFQLLKLKVDFVEYEPKESFDLIYFDAFAPSKQPELWTVNILQKCYLALKQKGVFVTYSAKGQLRRDLQTLGFTVERLPGPPGKFEMIRATKN